MKKLKRVLQSIPIRDDAGKDLGFIELLYTGNWHAYKFNGGAVQHKGWARTADEAEWIVRGEI